MTTPSPHSSHSPAHAGSSPESQSSTEGLRRRSVVAAAAWTVPAISLAAASPAFAASEDNPSLTLNAAGTLCSNTGIAGLRATVTSSTGRGLEGRDVTVTLPAGGAIAFADGTRTKTISTDVAGVARIPVITNPALTGNANATAITMTVTLPVPASSGGAASTLLATVPIQQRGQRVAATTNAVQRHVLTTHPPRIVGPYYAQSLLGGGGNGNTLHLIGAGGGTMTTDNTVANFTYASMADPVVANGNTLITYTTVSGITTKTHGAGSGQSGLGTVVGVSGSREDWFSLRAPGALEIRGILWVHDPSLPATGTRLADYPDAVVSRRTVSGRRTVSWVRHVGPDAGAYYWRDGVTTTVTDVSAGSTPIGENAFLEASNDILVRGEERLVYTGLSIASAYAAIVGSDTVATVWFVMFGFHWVWNPNGSVQTWHPPTPPASLSSAPTVALGYGYFCRGSLYYFQGEEVFWGSAGPVVTATSVALFGTN